MQASIRALLLIACCCFAAPSLQAQPLADFYKGKQIRLVVGTEAGQDYDTWARLVARHMRKYLPGNPAFVIENMPGAGSLIAANHLYNKAAQDGTTLGMVSRNIPNYALMRQPNANYDPLRFNWIAAEITHRAATRAPMRASSRRRICSRTSSWSEAMAPAPRSPRPRCS